MSESLKKWGRFLCSTYGKQHMREITDLVQQFHKEIVLSAEVLYERFGLENGENLLAPYFPEIQMRRYEDAIEIAEAEPLISYILSLSRKSEPVAFEPVQRVPGICFCPRGRWISYHKRCRNLPVQKILENSIKMT